MIMTNRSPPGPPESWRPRQDSRHTPPSSNLALDNFLERQILWLCTNINCSPLTQFPGGEIPVRTKVQIIPVLDEYLLVLLDDVDAGQAGDHAPPRVVKHHELCVWNEAVVGLVSQRGAIVL